MQILTVLEHNINQRHIDTVVQCLKDGGIVIYPTDSVYAIGCDALNNQAINRICDIKGINPNKTHLSIICKDISQIAQYARVENDLFHLIKSNTPGPFTFILKALSRLPKAFKGRKEVGVRIPANTIATQIVETLGHPILSTSVQGDTEDMICEPEFLAETYRNSVDIVLDAGRGVCELTTVVRCTEGETEVVRQGRGELL